MLEYKTQVYLNLPIIITYAPFRLSNFPSRRFNINGFQTKGERKLFPPLIHFLPSKRLSSLGRGGWQQRHAFCTAAAVGRVDAGSPAPLATARRAQGAPAARSPCLPPPATGAEKGSHATTDAAALPWGTGMLAACSLLSKPT